MTEKLSVLVVESERHAADVAIAELETAGHEVVRCFEPGDPSFPCAGLFDACPIDCGGVDVVLDVRRKPRSQPAPGEAGVACALRHRIPVVQAGGAALSPFDEWATEVLEQPYGVVAACERAAAAMLGTHSAVATQALASTLAIRGIDATGAHAHVYRNHGRLVVEIHTPQPLDHDVNAMVSVRVIAAIRSADPHASGIDVSVAAVT